LGTILDCPRQLPVVPPQTTNPTASAVGATDGALTGDWVGATDGALTGDWVGATDGAITGDWLGATDGAITGDWVGATDGAITGALVVTITSDTHTILSSNEHPVPLVQSFSISARVHTLPCLWFGPHTQRQIAVALANDSLE